MNQLLAAALNGMLLVVSSDTTLLSHIGFVPTSAGVAGAVWRDTLGLKVGFVMVKE